MIDFRLPFLFCRFSKSTQQIRTHHQSVKGSDLFVVVEHSGIEPLTSTLPV